MANKWIVPFDQLLLTCDVKTWRH